MNYRHPRALHVAPFALTFAAVLAACFAERGPDPQTSITEDTTAAAGQPHAIPSPPDAGAVAAGERAPLGIGSFCWPADGGGPLVCIDRSGIVTAADALVVERGETVVVVGPDLPGERFARPPCASGRPRVNPNASKRGGSRNPPRGHPRACPLRHEATLSPSVRTSSPAAGWSTCSSGSSRET